MKIALPALFFIICCGCRHQPEKGAQVMDIPHAEKFRQGIPDSSCYIHTAGLQQQDTTLIRVQLRPDSVVGTMVYQPWEKDSRRGSLRGIRHADSIVAVWNYMQQGQEFHQTVKFILEGDTLLWLNAMDEGKRNESGEMTRTKFYKTACP